MHIILKYTSAVQSLNVQCIASKSRLMCIALHTLCGSARADYRHIFDSNETSDSWRYDATLSRQKNGIRTFISLPKNVLERQRKEIFGVKTRPLARDGLCTEEMAVCGQLGTGG